MPDISSSRTLNPVTGFGALTTVGLSATSSVTLGAVTGTSTMLQTNVYRGTANADVCKFFDDRRYGVGCFWNECNCSGYCCCA